MTLADAPLLQTRFGCTAATLLLCLGIGIRLANLNIPTGRSPDETNYTLQALVVLKEGSAGLRRIAADYQRDSATRLAGPPTRAGYLWMLATTMRLTEKNDASVGAILSCAASIGSLFILTLIGIRFFPPWATLFAMLFYIVCPAELEMARRTWIDALVGFLGLSLVYVAGEITRNTRRRIWYLLFMFVGALGILVKEFGPVVFGLCTVWLLWVMFVQQRDFRGGLILTASVLVATCISIVWIAHSIGGLNGLTQTVGNWLGAHESNSYAIEYQSGPAYFLLRGFEVISPLAGIFCVVGLLLLLLSSRPIHLFRLPIGDADRRVIVWMTLFFLGYLGLAMILPHWLNLRYVSLLFGLFYLLAGFGFAYAVSILGNRLGPVPLQAFTAVVIVLLVIGAFSDYRRFDRMFVRNGIGDLSIKLVLDRADMTAAEKKVKSAPTAENYLNLCRLYHENWRYPDSVAACRKALELRPDYTEAYPILTAAYVEQELWDEAIEAAQTGLQLKPSLPLRDSLARSLEQKRLRDAAKAAAKQSGSGGNL